MKTKKGKKKWKKKKYENIHYLMVKKFEVLHFSLNFCFVQKFCPNPRIISKTKMHFFIFDPFASFPFLIGLRHWDVVELMLFLCKKATLSRSSPLIVTTVNNNAIFHWRTFPWNQEREFTCSRIIGRFSGERELYHGGYKLFIFFLFFW